MQISTFLIAGDTGDHLLDLLKIRLFRAWCLRSCLMHPSNCIFIRKSARVHFVNSLSLSFRNMHLTHSYHDTAFLGVVNFSRHVRCLSKLRTLDTHSLLHRLLCNVLLDDFRTNSNPVEWHTSWRRLLCVSNESHAHGDTGLLSEAAVLTRVNKMEMAGSWPRFIVGRTLNCSTCTWFGALLCLWPNSWGFSPEKHSFPYAMYSVQIFSKVTQWFMSFMLWLMWKLSRKSKALSYIQRRV